VPLSARRPPQLRHGPFRASDAVAAGLLTRNQLRAPTWRHLGNGTYIDSTADVTLLVRIRAAALWLPADTAFSGRTAAYLWGVDLADSDAPVEVVAPRRLRPRSGLLVRRVTLAESELTMHRGLRLTRPLHTAWEIARALPEVEGIAWVDALARRRRLSRSELRAHARAHDGERGNARASETLSLADPRAESAPESRLRVQLVRAGLPAPVPQLTVLHDGYFVARVDLAWPEYRLAVEYDGQWHADPAQLHRDRTRLRQLTAAGWRVYHVTREDMRDVPRIAAEIAEILRARGMSAAVLG
jgi:G:T-mismatch repair DNA endonuclease (very short patch repair protein)